MAHSFEPWTVNGVIQMSANEIRWTNSSWRRPSYRSSRAFVWLSHWKRHQISRLPIDFFSLSLSLSLSPSLSTPLVLSGIVYDHFFPLNKDFCDKSNKLERNEIFSGSMSKIAVKKSTNNCELKKWWARLQVKKNANKRFHGSFQMEKFSGLIAHFIVECGTKRKKNKLNLSNNLSAFYRHFDEQIQFALPFVPAPVHYSTIHSLIFMAFFYNHNLFARALFFSLLPLRWNSHSNLFEHWILWDRQQVTRKATFTIKPGPFRFGTVRPNYSSSTRYFSIIITFKQVFQFFNIFMWNLVL